MTWTKLSDDFAEHVAHLSDAAFRTHVEGLLWVMRRETDGYLRERDIVRMAETDDPGVAVLELLEVGLWERREDGYVIKHHMEYQPERAVLTARRQKDAERQARHRRKAAGLSQSESRRDKTSDARADEPRDPGRVGSGRAPTDQLQGAKKDEEPLADVSNSQLRPLDEVTAARLRQRTLDALDGHDPKTELAAVWKAAGPRMQVTVVRDHAGFDVTLETLLRTAGEAVGSGRPLAGTSSTIPAQPLFEHGYTT